MDCALAHSGKALNRELASNVIKMPCWLAERFYSIEDLRLEPYTTCRIPDSDAREAELVASILEFVAGYFNPRLSPIAKLPWRENSMCHPPGVIDGLPWNPVHSQLWQYLCCLRIGCYWLPHILHKACLDRLGTLFRHQPGMR